MRKLKVEIATAQKSQYIKVKRILSTIEYPRHFHYPRVLLAGRFGECQNSYALCGVYKIRFCSAMLPVMKVSQTRQLSSPLLYCEGTGLQGGNENLFLQVCTSSCMQKSVLSRIKSDFLCLRKNPAKEKEAWSFHRRAQLLARRDLEYISEIAWWEAWVSIFLPTFICFFCRTQKCYLFCQKKENVKALSSCPFSRWAHQCTEEVSELNFGRNINIL